MSGEQGFGFDPEAIEHLGKQVECAVSLGVEIAVVIGGGNLWRGGAGSHRLGIERVNADYMGMLGTVMNGLALQGVLERLGHTTRVLSAIEMNVVTESYTRRRAMQYMAEGHVVVFVAGTGCPFFSTDTVAALRAAEIGADLMIKATQVDGVYSADPRKDPNAQRFATISHAEYLARGLGVLDIAAVALCKENQIPVIVLSLGKPDNISLALQGEDIGTMIGGEFIVRS